MNENKVKTIKVLQHILTHKSLTALGYKMMIFRLILAILTPIYVAMKIAWKIIYQIFKPQSEVYKPKKREIPHGDMANPIYVKQVKRGFFE